MRNWNSIRGNQPSAIRTASRLPMRNWNVGTYLVVVSSRPRLPDYLWGIETNTSLWQSGFRYCFQTTYEELKLVTPSIQFSIWVYCFQTTYEELKLQTRFYVRFPFLLLPDYLWGIETGQLGLGDTTDRGFQTTYEELKRSKTLTMCWLIRFQTTYEELKRTPVFGSLVFVTWLPDYLWGIETLSMFY